MSARSRAANTVNARHNSPEPGWRARKALPGAAGLSRELKRHLSGTANCAAPSTHAKWTNHRITLSSRHVTSLIRPSRSARPTGCAAQRSNLGSGPSISSGFDLKRPSWSAREQAAEAKSFTAYGPLQRRGRCQTGLCSGAAWVAGTIPGSSPGTAMTTAVRSATGNEADQQCDKRPPRQDANSRRNRRG